jgi:hypothetical protein
MGLDSSDLVKYGELLQCKKECFVHGKAEKAESLERWY